MDVGGFEIVKVVIAALRLTLNTLPSDKFKVKLPADIVGEVYFSS